MKTLLSQPNKQLEQLPKQSFEAIQSDWISELDIQEAAAKWWGLEERTYYMWRKAARRSYERILAKCDGVNYYN